VSKTESDHAIPETYLDMCAFHHFPAGDDTNVLYGCGFLGRSWDHEDVIDLRSQHYDLNYVMHGTATYTDWHGKSHLLSAGTAFQRIPDKHSSTVVDKDSAFSVCCFAMQYSFSTALIALGYIDPDRPLFFPGISLPVVRAIADLYHNYRQLPDFDIQRLTNQALAIITDIYSLDAQRNSSTEEENLMHRAGLLLSEDLHHQLDMQEVAAKLGISYTWFRKLFKRHRGTSPGNYRIHRRIAHAAELLITKQATIKEVALRLGYADVPTFSRQFKKAYGIAPGAYAKSVVGVRA